MCVLAGCVWRVLSLTSQQGRALVMPGAWDHLQAPLPLSGPAWRWHHGLCQQGPLAGRGQVIGTTHVLCIPEVQALISGFSYILCMSERVSVSPVWSFEDHHVLKFSPGFHLQFHVAQASLQFSK